MTNDLQGRGAGVHHDGVPVLDVRGGGCADGVFLLGVDGLLEVEVAFLGLVGRGVGVLDGAAVGADEELPVVQDLEVFPDGDGGYEDVYVDPLNDVTLEAFKKALADVEAKSRE